MGCSPSKYQNNIEMQNKIINNDFEIEICNEKEIVEGRNGLKNVTLDTDIPVIVGRFNDKLFAVGGKCSHFGAPLINGYYDSGTLRCPWHGACFNVCSGDIEDSPGLDSLPVFNVKVRKSDGMVTIHGQKPASFRRVKPMAYPNFANKDIYVIIGGGPSALTAAETLRQDNFLGKIQIISADSTLPFDRTKLSKNMDSDPVLLRESDFYTKYGIDVLLKSQVNKINLKNKTVEINSKNGILVTNYSKLLICSGSTPRRLTINHPNNVFYLRNLADAATIFKQAKSASVVIIGSSFIGMETAATLVSKGKADKVTILGTTSVPFETMFGTEIGAALKTMHEERGVNFVQGHIKMFESDAAGNLTGVKLESGEFLKASLCVVGIGVLPNSDFVPAELLNERQYVKVDEFMRTGSSDVFAAGDVTGSGHWQTAQNQGKTAAKSMLNITNQKLNHVSFFWTQMFDKSVRYVSTGQKWDQIVIEGNLSELKFMAYFLSADETIVAGAGMGMDPQPARLASLLSANKKLTMSQLRKVI